MPTVTVIADDRSSVDATVADGRVLLDPEQLPDALGWTLKPEGLCRDDVCVPVRDRAALFVGERSTSPRWPTRSGRPVVVDADAGIVAIALGGEQRRDALRMLVAPDFELADLDGDAHRLSEWRGRKRLLHAFSSW